MERQWREGHNRGRKIRRGKVTIQPGLRNYCADREKAYIVPRVNPALRRRRISNGLDSVTVLPEAELLHLAAYFFKSGLHSRENCGIIRPVKAMTGTSTAGGTYREQPGDERRRGSRAGNTSPSFAPNGRQVGCDGRISVIRIGVCRYSQRQGS